jgi:RNA polymerase sigma-70 factor (ECF subfamily)
MQTSTASFTHVTAVARLAPRRPAVALMPVSVSWAEMAAHRGDLVRFARRRVIDPAQAEDLVHDVFEAVASGRATFAGRSALRSWLVAILKHKLTDLVRERIGHTSLDADDSDEGLAMQLRCPRPGPEEVVEQRERLAQTLQRIAALPAPLRQVVELRLVRDDSTEDVCRALRISESNLFVRLHRARRALVS